MTIRQYINNNGLTVETDSEETLARLDNEIVQVEETPDAVRLYDQPGFYVIAKYGSDE